MWPSRILELGEVSLRPVEKVGADIAAIDTILEVLFRHISVAVHVKVLMGYPVVTK